MGLNLAEVNARIRADAAEYVASCEEEYAQKVNEAARVIADRVRTSSIILLSGPSGSGKTTTAMKIQRALGAFGVGTKTVSMDRYYKTVDPKTVKRSADGSVDFESPESLDLPLLSAQIEALARGEEVEIPDFDFPNQCRKEKTTPLRVESNELIIFEGIHALNDTIAPHVKNQAIRLYISARSDFEWEDHVVFKGTWTRLCRRIIRDELFRGTSPGFTLGLWNNIRIGEKAYISPYKSHADIIINSTHPYEIGALRSHIQHAFANIPKGIARYNEICEIPKNVTRFEPVSESLIPEDSLLREFIGGGNFTY